MTDPILTVARGEIVDALVEGYLDSAANRDANSRYFSPDSASTARL